MSFDTFLGQDPLDLRDKVRALDKAKALDTIYSMMNKHQIGLDELVAYVESNPATSIERIQAHRRRNVGINRWKEGVLKSGTKRTKA